ncbi:hypothetical protein THAOC_07355 [Thalassiosira oceanica]|uniref:Uncharacterized protein n=1 Tax=Thalassiosira oceanica TaxID=159749 RepID=K0TKN0_THAOC|nr:hypothetical protein THAOC_07355 [Thalassiosira oceanica]|eukprot:EJK71227.1 hypothetical protein THAOC_07355 [Thalassiosira oceanica]
MISREDFSFGANGTLSPAVAASLLWMVRAIQCPVQRLPFTLSWGIVRSRTAIAGSGRARVAVARRGPQLQAGGAPPRAERRQRKMSIGLAEMVVVQLYGSYLHSLAS